MDNMGLLFRPQDYGVSHDEFINTILQMKSYRESTKFPFSILNIVDITSEHAESLWKRLS